MAGPPSKQNRPTSWVEGALDGDGASSSWAAAPEGEVALRCQEGALHGPHWNTQWTDWGKGRPAQRGPDVGDRLALTLLLLAACSDDSSPTVAPTSSSTAVTTAASTTPTTAGPGRRDRRPVHAVLGGPVRGKPRPGEPAPTGSGPARHRRSTRQRPGGDTAERRDQGWPSGCRGPVGVTNRVKVVEVVGDSATVQDCATNDGIIYRVASGQVLDEGVVTRSVEATMLAVDGVWRLADTRVLQEWKGVAGCAQSPDFS